MVLVVMVDFLGLIIILLAKKKIGFNKTKLSFSLSLSIYLSLSHTDIMHIDLYNCKHPFNSKGLMKSMMMLMIIIMPHPFLHLSFTVTLIIKNRQRKEKSSPGSFNIGFFFLSSLKFVLFVFYMVYTTIHDMKTSTA